MKKGALIFWVGVGVLIVGGIAFAVLVKPQNTNLQPFAQCLKEKGATFYGAYWCPHCQRQKALFGSAVGDLPYHECSTPDGQGQNDSCKQKNISNYPTWEFADGSRLTGERTLTELAEKTGCTLPQ